MSRAASGLLLALALLSNCSTNNYYRREAHHIGRMQDRDFRRGIIRADPYYYLNRFLGLPTTPAVPFPKRPPDEPRPLHPRRAVGPAR